MQETPYARLNFRGDYRIRCKCRFRGSQLLLGGGLASVISRKLGLSRRDVKTMFLCGAAAGFSAIFKAPLTEILFALEMPYKKDIETGIFIPASIASVSAYLISALTLGSESLFPVSSAVTPSIFHLLYVIILGILAALVALLFMEILEEIDRMSRWAAVRFPMVLLSVFFELILGIIGLFCPEVLGLGYDVIYKLTSSELGRLSLSALAMILTLKILATSFNP